MEKVKATVVRFYKDTNKYNGKEVAVVKLDDIVDDLTGLSFPCVRRYLVANPNIRIDKAVGKEVVLVLEMSPKLKFNVLVGIEQIKQEVEA